MARFNLKDYETVEQRLDRFWKANPCGRVYTELVSHSEDFNQVVIKASVWKDRDQAHPDATGFAEEHRSTGRGPNADCWWENCETSAIGRALANLGMSGSKRPSREEMVKASRKEQGLADGFDEVARLSRLIRDADAPLTTMSEFLGRAVRTKHDISQDELDRYIKGLEASLKGTVEL
tara:strand:+ start:1896 stop:2429 length:534 start_codon:yes stop_codon:yes gene_type:complete